MTICANCGMKVTENERFCWWCNADRSKEWEKCETCGQRIRPQDREPTKRE